MKFLFFASILVTLVSLNHSQFTYCPKFEHDVDFKGNDLKIAYHTETPEECAYLCSLIYNSCHGFTFWNISAPINNCFLKNFVSTSVSKIQAIGRISCVMAKFVTTTTLDTPTTAEYSKCLFDVNLFYGYTDLTDVFSADNAGECCDHCHKENAKCTAFSYLSDQKICHIYYSALPGKLNRFGTISGVINPSLKLITPLNTLQNNRCIIENGYFYGHSDNSDFTSLESISSCCDLCKNMGTQCLAFSFLNDQKICYIYYGTLPKKIFRFNTLSGRVSN